MTKEVKRPFAPWITDNLRALMQERNNVQQDLKYDRNNLFLREKYKALKKQVKKLLHESKSQYYNKALEENRGNTAATWRILKELLPESKNTSSIAQSFDVDMKSQKAEEYNKFFASVGENTFKKSQEHVTNINETPHSVDPNILNSNFTFRPTPVDSETIILTIKHVQNTHSYGSDGISLRFIRDALPVIITYIKCIFNTSIVTGVIPAVWKHAIVVPIFKSGDADLPNNYRPISLLPIL